MRKTFSFSVATVLATMLVAQEPAQAKFQLFERLENWAVKHGLRKPRNNNEQLSERKENDLLSRSSLQEGINIQALDKLLTKLAQNRALHNTISRTSLGFDYYIEQLDSEIAAEKRTKPPIPPRPPIEQLESNVAAAKREKNPVPPRPRNIENDETTAQLDAGSTHQISLQQESETQVKQYTYSTQQRNQFFLNFREQHPNLPPSKLTQMAHSFGATIYDTITSHMQHLDQIAKEQNLKHASNPSNTKVRGRIAMATNLKAELMTQRDPAYSTYRGLAYNVKQRLFNFGTTKFNLGDVHEAENGLAMLFNRDPLD